MDGGHGVSRNFGVLLVTGPAERQSRGMVTSEILEICRWEVVDAGADLMRPRSLKRCFDGHE